MLDLGAAAARRCRGDATILDERDVPIVALDRVRSRAGGIAERAVEAGAVSIVRKPFADACGRRCCERRPRRPHTARVRQRCDPARRSPRSSGCSVYPEEWAADARGAGVTRPAEMLDRRRAPPDERGVAGRELRVRAVRRRRAKPIGAAVTAERARREARLRVEVEPARRDVVRRLGMEERGEQLDLVTTDAELELAAAVGADPAGRRSSRRRRRAARPSRTATASRSPSAAASEALRCRRPSGSPRPR